MTERISYTVAEASEATGLSSSMIYRMIRQTQYRKELEQHEPKMPPASAQECFPFKRVGRKILIPVAALSRWLEVWHEGGSTTE